MAEPTLWPTVIGAAIPTVLSLLVIFSTRERSSGTDHSATVQNSADVAALKITNVEIQATLATHTAILRQLEANSTNQDTRLRNLAEAQAQAIGREQGRRHGG